jgi:hypothetical protein
MKQHYNWMIKWNNISNWRIQRDNISNWMIQWDSISYLMIDDSMRQHFLLDDWWFEETAFPIGWWNDHVTQLRACCRAEPNEGGKSKTTSGKRQLFQQCCGSGSISQRYGSGSGSFYHDAKIVRQTLIPSVLWLLFALFSLKNNVDVPSKSNKQKNVFLN